MQSHVFLNGRYLEIATKVIEWAAATYTTDGKLTRPPNANPSTVICPFLKAALETDHFQMAFHPEINGTDPVSVQELMISYIGKFKMMGPFHEENKKVLLIVFPNLEPRNVKVLDHVHEGVKTHFVKAGLMVAQFHSKCNEPSVHNKKLKTQVSEYPLMAIRYMQRHDILFLADSPEWFNYYERFFGDQLGTEKEKPDYYYDLYQSARQKHLPKK
jgi:heptaprenyl diphosphate synthase